MTIHQQLSAKVKALTVFLIENKGQCFGDTEASRLFKLVAFYLLSGNLFCKYDENGRVQMIVFARLEDSGQLLSRAEKNLPLFNWQPPQLDGDSVFIEHVIGARQFVPEIFRQITELWPDSPRRKLFTMRMKNNTPTLIEISWQTLERFCNYGRP